MQQDTTDIMDCIYSHSFSERMFQELELVVYIREYSVGLCVVVQLYANRIPVFALVWCFVIRDCGQNASRQSGVIMEALCWRSDGLLWSTLVNGRVCLSPHTTTDLHIQESMKASCFQGFLLCAAELRDTALTLCTNHWPYYSGPQCNDANVKLHSTCFIIQSIVHHLAWKLRTPWSLTFLCMYMYCAQSLLTTWIS